MNLVILSLTNLINNPATNTVDQIIASHLMKSYDSIIDMSIHELSNFLDVSPSQISRFIRTIGFQSYKDFKEALKYHGSKDRHSLVEEEHLINQDFQNKIHQEIDYFFKHFDFSQADHLIKEIKQFQHVALFGILKSNQIAISLQNQLLRKGKICVSYIDFYQQLKYIQNAQDNDLIIIFSSSGEYVFNSGYSRYYHTVPILKHTSARIIVITTNPRVKQLEYIDETIIFPYRYKLYHYSLQLLIDYITMNYDQIKTRKDLA